MKEIIDNEKFDTKLYASDWRYSAAIYGLTRYFITYGIAYESEEDYILYNSKDIAEEKYIDFVNQEYGKDFHHNILKDILGKTELSDDDIKLIKEKLSANRIMKKVFSKVKFNGENKAEILTLIEENKSILIKETYGKKNDGYSNYISINKKAEVELLKEKGNYCRLVGYKCADEGRKSKSLGYCFDKETFKSEDEREFDFIPFAFQGNREAIFINSNYSIEKLVEANNYLREELERQKKENNDKNINARKTLFKSIVSSSKFLDYDVEVIIKNLDKDYYETMYIRKEAIKIFRALKDMEFDYDSICFSYKVNDNYYINIEKEITDNIINGIVVDDIIETLLKDNEKKDKKGISFGHNYKINQMIKINILIRGEESMKDRLKGAYACAKKVVENIPENKVDSYRQKLISSIIFKDYDRANQILLQLSNYAGIEFGFIYDLFENFEENKDLAYTFINALNKNNYKNN